MRHISTASTTHNPRANSTVRGSQPEILARTRKEDKNMNQPLKREEIQVIQKIIRKSAKNSQKNKGFRKNTTNHIYNTFVTPGGKTKTLGGNVG